MTLRSANLTGSLLMVTAMAIFAVEDAFVKAAATVLPVGQTMVIFGLGGAAIFAAVALITKERLYTADVISRPMRIRVVFEIFGRLFYVLALALTPLSSATVILQATPLVVVAGAALIFGEQVGWRRWLAIAVGLIGVLVIIRPGADSFSALSILAVIGMLGFAGRDLASRAAPAALSTSILGLYGFLALAFSGGLYAVWQGQAFVAPDPQTCLYLLGAIGAGVAAYACLMKAMRTGEVSAVTPFRYTRLLFGIAIGLAVFGETLTAPMIIGSGLIVLSGLFIMWRGKQVAQD
ncbi:DMT family transporter [Litoreibacter albidus]|uniref:EamA-like transporter family protein n=1 Tax=Litoreibacter albidus TaxID=670155 RepID=A0A1H3B927_9RHOB|nr:DMT family transporter [Litoreibacter albidus]SDX38452.1 EamA-like transporter family protein [Litoreibacter albidus]